MPTSIAIADDHRLFAEALSNLIQKFDNYEVLFVAENGQEMLDYMSRGLVPDIALVDLKMPRMDGFETAIQLRQHYPTVRVLALSMTGREEHILQMIRNGARGYLLKGCRSSEFKKALDDVMEKEFDYSDLLPRQLTRNSPTTRTGGPVLSFNLNNREYDFLKMACSELTYNEIADRMCVSPRTVDGYREAVFQKMGVRTRVVMALEAVRHGLIEL
ncbi:response regulator transcription factor [Spirosoma taeanense]|uniref:Response regulator transcription factor n=1 Tax=Spirosoma taeanense TaxID=2735870 RepID=A0A6M5Y401_9BACT|nr:response regulator transcription factor [Spirosoma taeanense]QJW88495.1 response regulator transcription factor [Spirosoma taeanense]